MRIADRFPLWRNVSAAVRQAAVPAPAAEPPAMMAAPPEEGSVVVPLPTPGETTRNPLSPAPRLAQTGLSGGTYGRGSLPPRLARASDRTVSSSGDSPGRAGGPGSRFPRSPPGLPAPAPAVGAIDRPSAGVPDPPLPAEPSGRAGARTGQGVCDRAAGARCCTVVYLATRRGVEWGYRPPRGGPKQVARPAG
jgi:hypothetical protein